ncbi:MAG: MFS transporter [Armatimonadota bacterium]
MGALFSMALPDSPRVPKGTAPSGICSGMRAVLADRNLTIFNLGVGLYQAGQFNFFAYITLFMREALQASQPLAAACLGIGQAASAVGRLGWGVVSDVLFRSRRRPVFLIMGGLGAASLATMALLAPGPALPIGVALSVIIGLTVAGYVAIVQTIVVEAAPARLAATAVGYNRIYTAVGATLGPPIFGATGDLTGGYASGWLLTRGIVLASTLFVAVLFREGRGAKGPGDGPLDRQASR